MSMNRRKRKKRGKRTGQQVFTVVAILLAISCLVGLIFIVSLLSSSDESDKSSDIGASEEKYEISKEPIEVTSNSEDEEIINKEAENSEEDKSDKDTLEEIDEEKTDSFEEEAEAILAEMSLEEKVYQLFIVTPEQLTGVGTVTAAGSSTKESLKQYPVGGLIYLAQNLISSEQTSEMLHNSQAFALEIEGVPLFLCIDEEGGRVARIANNSAFGIGKIKAMSEVKNSDEAYEIGSKIGDYLIELGFNVDFAPDADVLTNSANSVIGDRSFGTEPDYVAECAVSYSDGLHEEGVLSTFKHFPGHGATADDTHQGFAYTNKTLTELKENELIPFMKAQDEGVDFIMISHISVPNILGDNTPCTLSEYMISEVLRGDLGYQGIVITDAMNMGAITSAYSNNQAVIDAINAGADIILSPVDFKSASNAVIAAVKDGTVNESTIDESVKRILMKKLYIMADSD